ncbi:MAG TPA: hypothetical protein VKC51_07100 [Lacunisphaera sp.]|nr:hypothetical protein [Lacunisphaera sp.]
MAATNFSITMHHLAPGAKAAGLAYPDEQIPAADTAQLRDLLYALAEIAAGLTIYEPSSPEIRIKTDREVFTIRTRYRGLCFVGYEAILRGEEHSVSFILSTITGTAESVKAPPRSERPATASPGPGASSAAARDFGGMPRWAKIAVMAVLIIGFNSVTAWMLLRPTHTPGPKYDLLPESESHALLIKTAGVFETGVQEGDRRIIIRSDGTLLLAKFGPQKTVAEENIRSARGALADGRAILVTSDPYVIELKDANTVVLYGVTYRRFTP